MYSFRALQIFHAVWSVNLFKRPSWISSSLPVCLL